MPVTGVQTCALPILDCLLTAPFAEFVEFDLAFDKLLILGTPIVDAFAFGAGQFDESVLGHMSMK